MSTATVTENIVALEPVTRDDFADEPARAAAETERVRSPARPRSAPPDRLNAHMSRPPLTPQTWPVI